MMCINCAKTGIKLTLFAASNKNINIGSSFTGRTDSITKKNTERCDNAPQRRFHTRHPINSKIVIIEKNKW